MRLDLSHAVLPVDEPPAILYYTPILPRQSWIWQVLLTHTDADLFFLLNFNSISHMMMHACIELVGAKYECMGGSLTFDPWYTRMCRVDGNKINHNAIILILLKHVCTSMLR
jgi:hypothetical protein